MGSSFSVTCSCDQVVNKVLEWLCLKGSYIHSLPENLTSLEKAIGRLKANRDDVQARVNREEFTRNRRRLAQVQVWLTSIITIGTQYDDLLSTSEIELQRLSLGEVCFEDLQLSYRYGERVIFMLREVENLTSQGQFKVVTEEAPVPEVEELSIQPTIVGQETMLEKVWNRLMGDEVRIVGLYGMGGVGKTTLLTQINNKFSETGSGFDIVIWVVVSKNATVQKIQGAIGEKLGLSGKAWDEKNETQRARDIHNVLRRKKFVLLLDDIWEKVKLNDVGVPYPKRENGCKVAFTTRFQDVCGRMGVDDPLEVRCLNTEKAWELFKKKVGENTLGSHPDIPELARNVAKKCKGLPLALNVIGETMSCIRNVREWQRAVSVLNTSATKFSGMKEEILSILKYSFDSLKGEHVSLTEKKGEQVQSCFLYCSLFPEDALIFQEHLIERWIGEGLIDGKEGRERALDQGYEILGTLVRACLLERKDNTPCVKMHDVVREMALWIASDLGKQNKRWIVEAGGGLRKIPKVSSWKNVTRMSLVQNRIETLSESLYCPRLTTLLLGSNYKLVTISGEFFRSMPRLRVLDLSWNDSLSALPEEISSLVSLRYLNMSGTMIEQLPVGLQDLRMLIHLSLEWTKELKSLEGISKLSSLRTLKLHHSNVWLDMSLMKELQLLEDLESVSITVSSSLAGEMLSYDPRIRRCIQEISIQGRLEEESVGVLVLPPVDSLRDVTIENCGTLEINIEETSLWNKSLSTPCFSNLSDVWIEGCNGLKDLTWLLFAPNLTSLIVRYSNQIEEIISKENAASVLDKEEGEETCPPFQKLKVLGLSDLPELKSIYRNALPFQCMKRLYIRGNCRKLRKLPLDSKSISKVEDFVIQYSEEGWKEGVEWEDEATRLRFLHNLRPL